MKRKLSKLGMLGILSVFVLTGCSSDSQNDTKTTPQSTVAPTQTVAPTETVTPSQEAPPAVNLTKVEKVDYLSEQNQIDENLKAELASGYTFEDPMVIVNPYMNSPLTAMVIFTTEEETTVEVTVKGKDEKNNVGYKFDASKEHMLPIYGLYSGDTTEVVLTLSDNRTTTLEIETEKIDTKLHEAEVTVIEEDQVDFSMFTFVSVLQADGGGYGAAAYDNAGDVRWLLKGLESANPIKRAKNGNMIVASSRLVEPFYYQSGLLEIDLIGKVYNDYIVPGGFHHDFVELGNGNILLCGDRPDFSTVEDYVVEIDRNTGEVVYELDLKTIFDPTDGGSINRSDKDWFHNNTVDYDEVTDTIILSGRHIDAVVAIDKTKKELKWILGNPEGWKNVDESKFFTPIDPDGTFEWSYAQHESVFVEGGDIIMFDNGAGRTKEGSETPEVTGDDVYSRAVRYEIDTDNMTVKQVWQYGKERGGEWYSVNVSGVQYLGEDDYWITSGAVRYDSEKDTYDVPYTFMGSSLVTACYYSQVKDNKLVYEMKFDGFSFRTRRMSLYPEKFNFDINFKGEYKGSLGIKATTEIDPAFSQEEAVKADFDVKFDQNVERFVVNGTWKETGEDAQVILKDETGETIAYKIEIGNKFGDAETVNYRAWISPDSLEGKTYQIYLFNLGVTYDTEHQVEF